MRPEEITLQFQQQLRGCANKNKYRGQFTREDEERALNIFESALEDSTLTPLMIFETLTKDQET